MAELYVADPAIERIETKKSKKARKTKDADEEIEEQHRSMLTAHYYRHNYATILHAAGVPVLQARDWLGHSNIQTTINIYTHLDKEKTARKAAEAQDFFR